MSTNFLRKKFRTQSKCLLKKTKYSKLKDTITHEINEAIKSLKLKRHLKEKRMDAPKSVLFSKLRYRIKKENVLIFLGTCYDHFYFSEFNRKSRIIFSTIRLVWFLILQFVCSHMSTSGRSTRVKLR